MFNQTIPRVGFACKIQDSHDKPNKDLNTSSTTITWLAKQSKSVAEQRLWDLVKQNVTVLGKQVAWCGKQPTAHRMFRITSDILPAYTHEAWSDFYFHPDMVSWLESNLSRIGSRARELDVRLSFHPGQFCVLASENPQVVENSLQEFEYHADVVRYMGYGKEFQDFKCNVHIGGKQGPQGIRNAIKKLSKVARNILTIENAEFTWGLEHSLELRKDCALVLDIHHHLVKTNEYIQPDDPRIEQVLESWRGVRPAMHYSLSREDVLVDHCANTLPDFKQLKSMGFTPSKLRAHSEYYWNRASNSWAKQHNSWADIMLEAKQKNLSRETFLTNQ